MGNQITEIQDQYCSSYDKRKLCSFDIEYIDSCEDFTQEAFAFHNRFAGKRSDITQSQNSSTVGDNGYQITF